MSPTVLVEREGHLAHVILNRLEVLNAIDNALGQELGEACEGLAADDCGWAIVLRVAVERAFCAGAHLKGLRDLTPELRGAQRGRLVGMLRRLGGVPEL